MIVAMGFALFRVAVQYLPIFPKDDLIVPSVPTVRSTMSIAAPVLEHAGD
jgi:hypothetical protein